MGRKAPMSKRMMRRASTEAFGSAERGRASVDFSASAFHHPIALGGKCASDSPQWQHPATLEPQKRRVHLRL
jgi:hypothetical protein